MNHYNYKQKIEYRNNLMTQINLNMSNNSLSMHEWYQKYMPFLPNEVLNIIPELEKNKKEMIEKEDILTYLPLLFNESKF